MKLKKIFRKILEYTLLLIIILLIAITFIPQNLDKTFYLAKYPSIFSKIILFFNLNSFYSSPLNIALWIIFTFLLLLFAVFKLYARKSVFALHIILLLLALTIFFDKAVNQDHYLTLKEGESINFGSLLGNDEKKYDFEFKLRDFTINYHSGGKMPSAFVSTVEFEDNTRKIEVNKPISIGNYKIYQNSYDVIPRFTVELDSLKFDLAEKDSVWINGMALKILELNEAGDGATLQINNKEYTLPINKKAYIESHIIQLNPLAPIMVSVLQISSNHGTQILFVLAILFLLNLGWVFWGKKEK